MRSLFDKIKMFFTELKALNDAIKLLKKEI